jgi:hypothetical protein
LINGKDIIRLIVSEQHSGGVSSVDEYLEGMKELGIDGQSIIETMREMGPQLVDTFVDDGEAAIPSEVAVVALVSGFEIGFRLALKKERMEGEYS